MTFDYSKFDYIPANGALLTTPMRLSYPYLAKPKPADKGVSYSKDQYCFDGIVPKAVLKNSQRWKAITTAAIAASKEKGQTFTPDQIIRMLFKDADLPNKNGNVPSEKNPDYVGHYVISFRTLNKPSLVNARNEPIADSEVATVLYPGCYVQVPANPYAYNAERNKGVAFGFNMLQKVADGSQFGGVRQSAAEVFEVLETGADDPANYGGADDTAGFFGN